MVFYLIELVNNINLYLFFTDNLVLYQVILFTTNSDLHNLHNLHNLHDVHDVDDLCDIHDVHDIHDLYDIYDLYDIHDVYDLQIEVAVLLRIYLPLNQMGYFDLT